MNRHNNRGKRAVLVIDSEQPKAENIKKQLIENGYRAYTAGSLNEALKIVEEKSVVVALLAFGRPSLDPIKLIKSLQRAKENCKFSVIVILESFSEELVASAFKAGAADYLTRPVDFQELIRRTGVYARIEEFSTDNDKVEIAALPEPEMPSPSKGLLPGFLTGLLQLFHSRSSADEQLGWRYEKVVRLGLGSFGEVWKVRDMTRKFTEYFVAKIPLSKKLNPKIEKEARILTMLAGHVGVPEILEIIEVRKKSVLIQEFVEGKTLFEVMERELEDEEVESVVIQLMDVVAYAHDLGIIHRDIKPGNVIVKPDGFIKLLDYGAAKELKDCDIACTVTGSRPYMSPEQILGQSQRRSDVWALGVVMYVLYTGMFPFYHDVEKVLMDMILEMPFPPPRQFKENMDPQIEGIILKCLEKDPANRFSDAGALKETIMNTIPGFGARILPLY
jgi:CheY-like chemotaxis protein